MSGHQNISEHFLSAREKSLEKKVVNLETQLQVYKSQIGKPVYNYRYCLGAKNEFQGVWLKSGSGGALPVVLINRKKKIQEMSRRPCGSPLTTSVGVTTEYPATSKQYPWKSWICGSDTRIRSDEYPRIHLFLRSCFKLARYFAVKPKC